jgi:hypothetical protein
LDGWIYSPAYAGSIINNGQLIFQRSDGIVVPLYAPLVINADISGNGSVTYRSGGAFEAGGATSSYIGGTSVKAGTTLVLVSDSGAGTGTIDLENSSTLGLLGGISVANTIQGQGAGDGGIGLIRNLSGTNSLDGAITLGGNSTFFAEGGSILLVNGQVTGGTSLLTTDGSGRVELTNSNTLKGLIISNGTTMLGLATSAGAGTIQIAAPGTLELTKFRQQGPSAP